MVTAQKLRKAHWWTTALALGAVTVQILPGAAEYLIYDRVALARGEWWRLLTAHLVHYSGAHLLNNLLVLIPAAWLVEERDRSDLVRIVLVSAVAIGVGIFVFESDIARYAGASGLSLALLTYVALHGLAGRIRWRLVCTVLLIIITIKLAGESMMGWQLVNWEHQSGFVTVPLSHAIGVVTALLFWLIGLNQEDN